MTEENNVNVEQNQAQTQIALEAQPQIKSEENQANWKVFREQKEKERKARQEAEALAQQKAAEAEALRAALEALTNKPAQHQTYEQSEETEESRIEKRVNQIIEEREKKAEEHRKAKEQAEYPQRLVTAYSDFHRVCSTENLDYLEYHYPELTLPYKHMAEGFDKWASIYKTIKKFVPNTDSKAESAKAERNLQKPGSVSGAGNSQGSTGMSPARLDEARKAANWERMQRSLKGLS